MIVVLMKIAKAVVLVCRGVLAFVDILNQWKLAGYTRRNLNRTSKQTQFALEPNKTDCRNPVLMKGDYWQSQFLLMPYGP